MSTHADFAHNFTSTVDELIARTDMLIAIHHQTSVESGKYWPILSATFRRFTWQEIADLRSHLSYMMCDDNGRPTPDMHDKVNLYFDLAILQDCLMEGKRDVCRICHCMEGTHRDGLFCREQSLWERGLSSQVSNTFTR